LSDSVETALKWGEGTLLVLHQPPESSSPNTWIETLQSNRMYSPATGRSFDQLTLKHFSFNSPQGACPVCHGLGQKLVFDPELIVPAKEKSLEQGAILPWRRGGKRMIVYYKALSRGLASHCQQSLEAPYKDLSEEFRRILLHGSDETEIEFHFWRAGKMTQVHRPFEGVIPNLQRLYVESESEFTKNRLQAFMSPETCDACDGQRLKPEILAVTLQSSTNFFRKRAGRSTGNNTNGEPDEPSSPGVSAFGKAHPIIPGLSIMDVCGLSIDEADEFFAGLELTDFQQKIAADLVKEIRARLGFLKNVGLGYLT